MKTDKAEVLTVFLDHYGVSYKVGRLAYSKRQIYFEYDTAFIERGLQISPYKLPLQKGVILCDDKIFEGLFGVFADSLPDGWGRLLIDRHLHTLGQVPSSLTPLDRLLFVGKYGMGALAYEPEHSINIEYTDAFNLDELALHAQEILKGESEEMLEVLLSLNGSSAGARPKAMIQINHNYSHIMHGSAPLKEGYEHWIVKFPSSLDSKESGAIEYAYSLMAKDAGIIMPKTTLLKAQKGSYFACERFDRNKDAKIHVHTVAGLLHADFRFPSLDYDDILSLTYHLTKDIQEVEHAYRLACFNVLSHNRDDHAKNFSFIMDQDGAWKLSPSYDLTFSSGPAGEHSTTVLGEGKTPTQKHLISLAQKHQLKNAHVILQEVQKAIQAWDKYASQAQVSTKTKALIAKIIQP